MPNLKLGLVTILILIIFIFAFIIFIPFWIYRWILNGSARVVKPYTHIVAPQSHFFIYGSNPMGAGIWANVIVKFRIAGKLDFEACKNLFGSKVIYARNESNGRWIYPEFQQYFEKWGGFYFWKQEKDFRIDQHIILYNKSPTKERRKLHEIERAYLRAELPLEKSPWEILVINMGEEEKENREACFVVLFKFHHSLADGYAIYNALMRAADEPPLQIIPRSVAPSRRNFCSKLKYYFTLPFACALEIAKAASENTITVSPLPCWENLPIDVGPDKSRQEISVGPSPPSTVTVAQIKQMSTKFSVGFTTVLVAAITGGFRNFLAKKLNKLPQAILCSLPIPDPQHPNGLLNSVGIIQLKVPIATPNIRHRLNIIEADLKKLKGNSIAALMTHFVASLAGYLPRNLFRKLLPPAPICLSIFPGPLQTIKFNGQTLSEMDFTILSSPHFAVIRMMSYANQLSITLTGDHRAFSRQELSLLSELIQKEFSAIKSLEINRNQGTRNNSSSYSSLIMMV